MCHNVKEVNPKSGIRVSPLYRTEQYTVIMQYKPEAVIASAIVVVMLSAFGTVTAFSIPALATGQPGTCAAGSKSGCTPPGTGCGSPGATATPGNSGPTGNSQSPFAGGNSANHYANGANHQNPTANSQYDTACAHTNS
jgi:hypothetical protein